jgi:hypothetical protein
MRTFRAIAAIVLATNYVAATAYGAQCVSGDDMTALRTAAMQQNLMVAALTCHDVGRYNRFVLAHQPELIDSDARLKQFFIHRGGEGGYHTYKTELANAASLRSIRESDSFCADAREQFEFASRPISLAAMVATQPVSIGVAYRDCSDRNYDSPRMAAAARPGRQDDRADLNADDAYSNEGQKSRSHDRYDDPDDEDSDDR